MSNRLLSVKDLAKLEKRRVRDELGIFIVEGRKGVEEAVAARAEITQLLVTGTFRTKYPEFLEELKLDPQQISFIADHTALRLTHTEQPSGIFAIIKKREVTFEQLRGAKHLVALDNIRDPGNLGTMIRTADWFGVDGLLLSDSSVDIYNDKVIRSSMGSFFHLPVYTSRSLAADLETLKHDGIQIIVTRPEMQKSKAPRLTSETKWCIVMGNESLGTSPEIDELADAAFAIPQFGSAESLNVAVSFGIVMYHFFGLSTTAAV